MGKCDAAVAGHCRCLCQCSSHDCDMRRLYGCQPKRMSNEHDGPSNLNPMLIIWIHLTRLGNLLYAKQNDRDHRRSMSQMHTDVYTQTIFDVSPYSTSHSRPFDAIAQRINSIFHLQVGLRQYQYPRIEKKWSTENPDVPEENQKIRCSVFSSRIEE